LYHFQDIAEYWSIFAVNKGHLSLTHSFRVNP